MRAQGAWGAEVQAVLAAHSGLDASSPGECRERWPAPPDARKCVSPVPHSGDWDLLSIADTS